MELKSAKELLSAYTVEELERIMEEELDAIGISHTKDELERDFPIARLSYEDVDNLSVSDFLYYEDDFTENSFVDDSDIVRQSGYSAIYINSIPQNNTFQYDKLHDDINPLNAA